MKKYLQKIGRTAIATALALSIYSGAFAQDTKDLLDMSLEEIMNMQINVASGSKALTQRESPGIVSVVTEDEIRKSGARDLIDVLELVPGITFNVDVSNAVGISMRGNWAHEGKVLLLLDGQEFNDLHYAANQFGNHFPVSAIKRIEIIRGPGSAIYGGAAELGVINVITKAGEDIDGIAVSQYYGQMKDDFGRKNTTIMGGKKDSNFAFSVYGFFGEGNRSDKPYKDIYGNGTTNNKNTLRLDPNMINMSLKYSNLSLRFIYDYFHTTTIDKFTTILPQAIDKTYGSYLGEIKYEIKLSDNFSITPRFNYVFQEPWKALDTNNYSYAQSTRYKGNIALNYAFDLNADTKEKVDISAGAEFYKDHTKIPDVAQMGTFTNGKDYCEYDNTALFLQALVSTRIANFTIGGRYDKQSDAGGAFAPRIGITKVIGDFHTKLLYSQSFRSPVTFNFEYKLENKLDPEKTNVLEMEFGYKATDNLLLTANCYYLTIDKTIVYKVLPDGSEGYINAGKTGTLGMEFESKYLNDWGTVNLNYSFNTAHGKNEINDYKVPENDNVLLGMPQHKVTLNSSINIARGFSVNPSIVFMSERNYVSALDQANNQIYSAGKAQLQINLFFNYDDFIKKGLNVGFGAYNITNQDIYYYQPYSGNHAKLPGASTEFVLRASYNFGI